MTEWITSPANTAIACLLVIVLAVFAVRGVCRREEDNAPKQIQPEDIRRRIKKKSAACAGTQTTQSKKKHSTYNIPGGRENVKTL